MSFDEAYWLRRPKAVLAREIVQQETRAKRLTDENSDLKADLAREREAREAALSALRVIASMATQSFDTQHGSRICREIEMYARAALQAATGAGAACCQHRSDCANHRGPAEQPGPCSCGTGDPACPHQEWPSP